ncbi:recombinase family protein [Streptomyces sp. TRM70350]|uniref:recombinase family protein n=1 Tax=Streptomyces sp. TRM70350 TaxID=2856165 RepID=UPI001C464DE7|nr:recombinase family protein [Streptomyces sp. TRM70350]MBV7700682.1 recombinase family protein [Streptomyces sp. TRM70350]
MRPAIYGYMRVVGSDIEDDEARRIKGELADYATREGFALDQVFTENIRCSESAFYAMLEALKQYDVKDVLVPSLWHFARLPGLQEAMRQHIEQETGARLWVVQGRQQ